MGHGKHGYKTDYRGKACEGHFVTKFAKQMQLSDSEDDNLFRRRRWMNDRKTSKRRRKLLNDMDSESQGVRHAISSEIRLLYK
ncbi:hypothetical protein SK128_004198 [Halocaridina rubra]|uniref:Uncharacterized protein n=1 Tax=Halocaridina rubra TaxID=373956 RepID=A0AAN8ZUZ7_HALRR